MSKRNIRQHDVACSITRLTPDFKRILRVQLKEFLHYLDEAPLINMARLECINPAASKVAALANQKAA